MWSEFIAGLPDPGTVEFGMHQLERNESGRLWRRHDNRSRFENLFNALFSDKGAFAACTGVSKYPLKYSATGRLVVPYAAAWIQGEETAILVRAATPLPEATLISSEAMEQFSVETDMEALQVLASIFGEGASTHGVRWISNSEVVEPTNLR